MWKWNFGFANQGYSFEAVKAISGYESESTAK